MAQGMINSARSNGSTSVSALSGRSVNARGRAIKRPGDVTGRQYQAQQDGLTAQQQDDAQFEADTAEMVEYFRENRPVLASLSKHKELLPYLAAHLNDLTEIFAWWDTLEYEDADDTGSN